MKKEKKKKEKITYIDDGRTIADMSGVGRGARQKNGDKKQPASKKQFVGKGTPKDQWTTYKEAVKMMFGPMLVTIGFLCVAFLLVWIIVSLM